MSADAQAVDAALQPPIIAKPGPEHAAEVRIFQGIPGIERAPGGRLWATWYGGGPTEGPWNYVMLNTSADDGETWSDVRAFAPCLWMDPGGRLWLFWAQGWTLWDGRAGVWAITTDDPDSADPEWSAPRRLCNGVMMNKPIALSTGTWLLPAAVWSLDPINCDPANYRKTPDESGSNVVCSTDEGETWELLGGCDVEGRACDEHMVVERNDGSLWLLARTTYGIGESTSADGGRTWSESQVSSVGHIRASRFFIKRLASGKLLLVKHNPPDGKTRSHLTAYLSDDDGGTWQGGYIVDARRHVSYPDATQAADGTIYLIYDFERTRAKQILMATFTEADVLAGEAVSDAARQRVMVNQATGTKDE